MEVAASNSKQLLLPMAPPRDPNSPSSSTSSSSPSSAASPSSHHPPPTPPTPPPRPAPRIVDTTPFPTTFVQADTASFKQVVQMLTGAADMPPPSSQAQAQRPPAKAHHVGGGGGVPCRAKKPAFKLYERRSGMKNLKMITPLAMAAAAAAGASPRAAAPELLLSPSVLDFPSLALSPVTPLVPDPFNRSASGSPGEPQQQGAMAEERAAIARKGFFLHPSPRAAAEPPRLLPLFPVTSPRMAAPSSEL